MKPKDKNADWLLKPFQGREPVAWGMMNSDGNIYDVICPDEHKRHKGEYKTALFLAPQYRELSDEEIFDVWEKVEEEIGHRQLKLNFARAILKKASEK